MIGPVGVGEAVVVATVVALVNGGAEGVTVVDTTAALCLYMLSLLPPPQYSVAFALHSMLQPVSATVRPGTRADPGLMVFPQKHSPEYSTPK